MSQVWRLLRLLAYPIDIIRQLTYATGTISQAPLKRNYLAEIWVASPLTCVVIGVMNYVLWMLNLGYVILIAGLIESIREGEGSAAVIILLGLTTLARLGVSAVLAIAHLHLAEAMGWRFSAVMMCFHNTLESSDRVAKSTGRELRILLESADAAIGLQILPFTLVSYLAWVIWSYGISVSLALGILAIVLPFSLALARVEDKVFAQILSEAGQRQEKCRWWLHIGPLLLNWGHRASLDVIEQITRGEIRLRNVDSALRSSDTYLFNFGRIVPFAILSFFALETIGTEPPAMESYWIAFPLMALALDLPRLFVSSRNGHRALTQLHDLDSVSSDNLQQLRVDNEWKLWSGSVSRNLIHGGTDAERLVKELGLVGELGGTPREVLEFLLTTGGRNLSQGQRLRLLIARGVNLALYSGYQVCIDCELSSLDRNNQMRVKALVDIYPKTVKLGQQAENSLTESTHANPYGPNDEAAHSRRPEISKQRAPSKEQFDGLSDVLSPAIFLLFIPATGSAALALLVESPITPAVVALLLWSAPLGVACGIALGYIVEVKIRRNAERWLIRGLEGVHDGDSMEDQFQIVSHDFDSVNERVAWYIHDIAWIACLAAITVIVSLTSIGWSALGICLLISVAYFWLWRRRVPLVVRTRLEFVEGMNRLLEAADDVRATRGLYGAGVESLRNELVIEGLGKYIDCRTRMNAARLSLGLYAAGLTGSFAFLLALSLSLANVSAAWAAIVFTTVLALDAEILRLLLALSGLQSQVLALDRLREFSQPICKSDLIYRSSAEEYEICALQAEPSGLSFGVAKLTPGLAYSVLGRSGSGKSQFLKSIAGLIRSVPACPTSLIALKPVRVIYVDSRWREAVGKDVSPNSLAELLTGLCQRNMEETLLILDEALATLSPTQAKAMVNQLCLQLGEQGVVLLVDHRFCLGHSLNVEELRGML